MACTAGSHGRRRLHSFCIHRALQRGYPVLRNNRADGRACELSVHLHDVTLRVPTNGNGQERTILRSVSLMLRPGELHMLVGPNGCGKSSLLRVIGGLEQANEGSVHVVGPCAFVFQNPDHQIVMPTVAAEVALGTGRVPMNQHDLVPRVMTALKRVGLSDLAEVTTSTLSGGQKQRVAIASALAQGPPAPQVLLLDELTTFLDFEDAASVLESVQRVVHSDNGVAAIWVTHRLEELEAADAVTYMEEGTVVRSGTSAKILAHLRSLGASV